MLKNDLPQLKCCKYSMRKNKCANSYITKWKDFCTGLVFQNQKCSKQISCG